MSLNSGLDSFFCFMSFFRLILLLASARFLIGGVFVFNTRFSHSKVKGVSFPSPSMTLQEFKDECNINSIIARFTRTGVLDSTAAGQAIYGDFSTVEEFQIMQNKLINAQANFDTLPSSVRQRFDNDPAKLIAFLADDSNKAEAIALGLCNEVKVEQPAPEEQA